MKVRAIWFGAMLGAVEAHLEAGVLREEHLVAGLDPAGLAPDRGDDPGQADRLGRCGDDQPGLRLRLLIARLDDDVVVERLERKVDALDVLHAKSLEREGFG